MEASMKQTVAKWVRRVVVGVLLLGLFGTLWATRWAYQEYQRRTGLYWYEVAQDTRIGFPGELDRFSVQIGVEGLTWPVRRGGCDTAMLRLSMRSTLSGRWFEPAVVAEAPGADPFVQYFERRVDGARWLNVSPLCESVSADTVVGLAGRHVQWEPQDAELVLFPKPQLDIGPLLVLAPHPDDAEIAAFGLYRAIPDTYVITITAGDYEGRGLEYLAADPAARAALRGRLRVWDSAAVPLFGGIPIANVANLGYFNGLLRKMHTRRFDIVGDDRGGSTAVRKYRHQISSPLLDDRAVESTWESLVEDLVLLLGSIRPTTVVTPHPLLDRSDEHQFTTVALLEALSRLGDPPMQLLLYTNHAPGSEYFPFGPADGWMTLPPVPTAVTLPAVYSFALSEEALLDKLFALDAMHDLRAAPRRQLGDETRRTIAKARRLAREFWADPYDYYSYFRRAVRPNELFVVVGLEHLDKLRTDLEVWLPGVQVRHVE